MRFFEDLVLGTYADFWVTSVLSYFAIFLNKQLTIHFKYQYSSKEINDVGFLFFTFMKYINVN